MMPPVPQLLTQAFVALCFVACVAGFLACCVIWGETRQGAFHRVLRVAIARWSAVFFAGAGVLVIDCAMGDRAPLPISIARDGVIGLGSVAIIWLLICAGGFAVGRAVYYRRLAEMERRCEPFPADWRTGMRLLALSLLLLLAAAATGCQAPSVFATAEDLTYKAIAPDYTAYFNADPLLDPAGKARRLRTLQLWRSDIDEQLKGAANAGNPTSQPASGQ